MNLAQSPHNPWTGKRPGLSDIVWLVLYSVRGLAELIRARIVFARFKARDIPSRNAAARRLQDGPAPASSEAPSAQKLARISYVLPRLSARLPWRSDCLIQAIAAQNWLKAGGNYGEIRIGVENPKDAAFGAHAWLVHGDCVVTGGDITRYSLLLSDAAISDSRGTKIVVRADSVDPQP